MLTADIQKRMPCLELPQPAQRSAMRSRSVLSSIAAAAFAAALFLPTPAAAQGTALGVKAGATVSTLSFEDMPEGGFNPSSVDSRSGFLVGVTFRKDINARAAVQVEGVYAQG